jgi:hypothetical protein
LYMAHAHSSVQIFEYLADSAEFVDRIELSVGEQHFREPVQLIHKRMLRGEAESVAIGGKNSLYARLLRGRCKYSKNPVDLKYGKRKTYARCLLCVSQCALIACRSPALSFSSLREVCTIFRYRSWR